MDKTMQDHMGINDDLYLPDLYDGDDDGLGAMRGIIFVFGLYALIGMGFGLYAWVT